MLAYTSVTIKNPFVFTKTKTLECLLTKGKNPYPCLKTASRRELKIIIVWLKNVWGCPEEVIQHIRVQ